MIIAETVLISIGFLSLEVCKSMIIAQTVLISIGFLSLEVCKTYDYSRDGPHFYRIPILRGM